MNPKQLKNQFPYMFEGENVGFSFYRGWTPLFAKLCADIDTLLGKDKRGFHWTQVKEKLGSARFYWGTIGRSHEFPVDHNATWEVTKAVVRGEHSAYSKPSLSSRINELVLEATIATESICIVCGQAATLNRDGSVLLVLCEHHAQQRRLGKLEWTSFSEEEH